MLNQVNANNFERRKQSVDTLPHRRDDIFGKSFSKEHNLQSISKPVIAKETILTSDTSNKQVANVEETKQ